MAMAGTATMARGRRPLDTTTDTTAMADTEDMAAMVDMVDTDMGMAMAKERQSQAITVVAIMDTVATEAMVDMVDTVDTVDMAATAMASGRQMLAITMVTRAIMVDMEATDMAMAIMVRPALVQEFSA